MLVRFEKTNIRTKNKIGKKIGIRKNGQIVIYNAALPDFTHNENKIFMPDAELYFDPETRQIGIKPVMDSDSSIPVKGANTKIICAKKFFNRFDVNPLNVYGRYDYIVHNGMLIIQLN
jgi:hypothetical protein